MRYNKNVLFGGILALSVVATPCLAAVSSSGALALPRSAWTMAQVSAISAIVTIIETLPGPKKYEHLYQARLWYARFRSAR